jgi:predicted  nucleic acid-binding Zn-ribbon protein
LAALSFGQVARPKLNSLEARKGRDIAAELTRAQAEANSAPKQVAQAESQAAKSYAAVKGNADPKQAPGLQSRLTSAQQRLTQAQTRAKQAQKRVVQLQAQQADWEAKTLKTHAADGGKYRVNWDTGQIEQR